MSCLENEKHGLQSGDQVVFREVKGMTAINGTTHTVRGEHFIFTSSGILCCTCTWRNRDEVFPFFLSAVLSPTVFSIGDTSGEEFKAYQHGGIVRQVKVQRTLTFVSFVCTCTWCVLKWYVYTYVLNF